MDKQDREALESFVATGDTSVPGIEISDINDGDILSRTRDELKGEAMRFVYQPEDGSEPIVSDFFKQENRSKYAFQWLEGVKGALVSRAASKVQEAKDAAYALRAKQIRDEQFATPATEDLIHDDVETAGSSPVLRTGGDKVIPKRNTSPDDYVGGQLEAARERLRAAEEAQQSIIREVLVARKDFEKWSVLASALADNNTPAALSGNGKPGVILSSRRAGQVAS